MRLPIAKMKPRRSGVIDVEAPHQLSAAEEIVPHRQENLLLRPCHQLCQVDLRLGEGRRSAGHIRASPYSVLNYRPQYRFYVFGLHIDSPYCDETLQSRLTLL